jgi:type I restriction enzyme S subunit
MGQAPPGAAYNHEGMGWPLVAGASDFGNARPNPGKFTSEAPRLSKVGDIILGVRATIGVKVLSDREYCLGRGVAALRPGSELDERFLWHWLSAVQPVLASKARGATFKQVTKRDISELELDLPPLAEQRRIADILDRADDLRAKRQAAIDKLDSLTQAIFHDMFGDPKQNPMRWPSVGIKELCSLVVDCEHKTAPIVEEPTPYRMIRTTNVRNGEVNLATTRYVSEETFDIWTRRVVPRAGDVILTREAPVGEAGILRTVGSVFLGQRLMLYRADPVKATPEYLVAMFQSGALNRQFDRHGSGSTVKHLKVPVCENFTVLAPPFELQAEFSERALRVSSLKESDLRALREVTALVSCFQSRAFSGAL